MDIMMRLKGAGFSMIANEFHARESRLGGGLPLQDFVEIVLQGLPRAKNAGEKYTNVNALIELFDEIDINGDGVMEFDEFTSFCVDAGMVATRVKTPTLKHRYVRNPKHVIKTASGCVGIEKVKWSKEFKQLMAIENTAKSVKLFDSTGKFLAEVGGKSTLHVLPVTPRANDASKQHEQPSKMQTPGSPLRGLSNEADRSPSSSSTTAAAASTASSSSGIFILDAVFLFKYQWLAMSTTDFVISFYDMNDSRKSPLGSLLPDCKSAAQRGPSFALIKALTITTTTAQLFLRFCEQAGLLFSAGNDFVLNVWKIIDAETKVLWKRLILHQDMVMDLIEIPHHDLIVSCDLHHAILLWDIHDCRTRGSLVGHTHGVKQLVYSSHHDLLLSAGFEFDAYGWDLASRQVVMRLTGHRAPLVGVQIALFQTERAVTADCMGVFKVWDISRSSGMTGGIATASSRSGHGLASQAVQLESIDPSHQFSRFEPTAFVCLHPHRRDLWTATAGTATLHLLRSTRVQQLDEIPLRAFYHYNANKFIVVAGRVCSIWDGATGICLDEFAHVGNIGGNTKSGKSGSHAAAAEGTANSSSHSSTTHNGSGSSAGSEPSIEVLTCVQDTNCKKLVVVTERGELGVFNALNFVQMRKCQEVFYGQPSIATTTAASHPTCSIVGLHYCSVNKLIIVADANESAILVIDDNPNHDSARGMKEATVLRRLTHIPGGISASAYGFHVCLVATVSDHEAQQNGAQLSLWDFETLSFVAHCEFEQENDDHTLHLVEFWPEFPVLVAADTLGGVFFYAATPLIQCNTGKLLYSFANDHAGTSSASQCRRQRRNGFSSSTVEENEDEDEDLTDAELTTGEDESSKTFLTEATRIAARKMLKWRKASLEKKAERSSQPEEDARRSPPACIVTCLKIVYDEGQRRYLLFTGDESGVVRIWELAKMIERLSLSKIPEIKCKYLRRGYQPKAMFSRDYFKDVATTNANAGESRKHHQPILNGAHAQGDDWRIAMLGGEDVDPHFHPSQTDLKRLSRRRLDAKKRPTLSSGVMRQNQHLQALPRSSQSSATTASVAFAAAKAFLVGQKKNSLRGPGKVSSSSSSSAATPNQRGSRLLSLSGAPTTGAGRHREHVTYNDIEIVHSWQAHADGLTSLEVSRNPNIVITCALDMRVFVWNWQGACLGKLFDAENIGRWPWRFTKDDSQRQAERDQLVRSLIRDIELTPLEKAQKRRQTLYQEHIARKSLKDLQRVNTVLLDHIISKNPELDLLVAVESSEEEQLRAANTAAMTPSDAQIKAALEKNRLRNCQTKFGMMLKMEKNSPFASAPTIPLVDRPSQRPEELQNSKVDPEKEEFSDTSDHERNHHLRMHSLAQVGPLLCVDKFEYKHSSALSSTTAGKMQFVEIDDLEMDKKYLEHELSISFSTSLSSVSQPPETTTTGEKTNMADVQTQIESAHLAAKDAFESRVTLERKTADMYTNLEAMKPKSSSIVSSQKTLPVASSSVSNDKGAGGLNWELLEPSEFLKQHLLASQITIRPRTAPAVQKKLQHGKKGLPLTAIRNQISTPSIPSADGQRDTGLTRNNLVASVIKKVHPSLPQRRQSVIIDRRKSSLDVDFMDQVKRHHQPPHGRSYLLHKATPTSSMPQVTKTTSTLRKDGNNKSEGNESDDDGHSEDTLTLGDEGASLSKLRTINQIIAKAQDYSSPGKESSSFQRSGGSGKHTRPKTAPSSRASTGNISISGNVPDPHDGPHDAVEDGEEDKQNHDKGEGTFEVLPSAPHEDLVRQHLDETKRKMESAMRDGERGSFSSSRADLKKLRHRVQQQKKVRRMEDYLQQKRREMNTNIGNVFKRTSFAFQSRSTDNLVTTGAPNGLALTGVSKKKTKVDTLSSKGVHHPATLEKKPSRFGIYGVREVMSVIRLFWSMDEDGSGSISLEELLQYKQFFEKLGYNDMTTVFQAIDKDGNGHVSLKELLEICFHYATKYQIEEMLTLAKVGSVRSYLECEYGAGASFPGARGGETAISAENRRELLEIFRVFDKNGDGGVSRMELMEALRVDDDDVMARVMTEQSTHHGSGTGVDAISSSGITKDDVERLYDEFDADRNASLDFDEFVALLRTLYGPKSNAYFR